MLKAHTLPSRTSGHTSQNLAKSVLFPTQKKIQFFFSHPSEKIKTPETQTNTTKTQKLNNDNGLQTRWTRTPAGNRRLAQWRVKWLIEHSTSHQLLWCIDSFVLRNPPLRQAPKRYGKLKQT
jgi:hypothetical protein